MESGSEGYKKINDAKAGKKAKAGKGEATPAKKRKGKKQGSNK